MVISHSHRFIFIHSSKAAGTSIQNALREYAHQPDSGKLNRYRSKLGLQSDYLQVVFPEHDTAAQIRKKLPSGIFDSYFKFAFVRNPWDWLVSLYHYLLSTPSHRHHRRVSEMENFEEYLQFEMDRGKRFQKDFVADKEGRLLTDYIGRYESLHEDFETVCRHLNIDASLPHLNKSTHRDYRDYYTDQIKDTVTKYWKEDIELLGYDFGNQDLKVIQPLPDPE